MESWGALRTLIAVIMPLWLLFVSAVAGGRDRLQTIDVEDVRPGMRGYGLTVFRGTKPERFDVEVIDVMHNFLPSMDIILIRTDHPTLEHTASVGGMSGSPIYLEGKLAGAYAYGWPFGKDPIAGVTPIKAMMAELGRPVRKDAFPGADRLTFPRSPRAQARTPKAERPSRARLAGLAPFTGQTRNDAFSNLEAIGEKFARGRSGRARSPKFERVATPLLLGGVTSDVIDMLGEKLAPFGLMPVQAGGGGGDTTRSAEFVDGGAIGVQLVRGDINATGIGTITHVDGRRLLAFGHPMMNAGEVGLPTSTAEVVHVLASQSRSFKLANALAPKGTLIQDRQPAIVVDTELEASTIPVEVKIVGAAAPKTEWRMRVANHRLLTPMLIFSSIANALQTTESDRGAYVFSADVEVNLGVHGVVQVTDTGFLPVGPSDAGALTGIRLFDLLEVALGNPFETVNIEGVKVLMTLTPGRRVERIVRASVPRTEVHAGEDVRIRVELERFGGETRSELLTFKVPRSMAGETLDLEIQSGAHTHLPSPIPTSVADLITAVKSQPTASTLLAWGKHANRGLSFRGHVVDDLPNSALDGLHLDTDTDRGVPFATPLFTRRDTEYVISGTTKLRLNVRAPIAAP